MRLRVLTVVAVGAFALVALPQDITIPGGVSASVLAVVGAVTGVAWYLLRRDRHAIDRRLDGLEAAKDEANKERGGLIGRVTTLEVRVGSIPNEATMERRWTQERHDTMEAARKHIMRPLTDEIKDLEARLARLEPGGRP